MRGPWPQGPSELRCTDTCMHSNSHLLGARISACMRRRMHNAARQSGWPSGYKCTWCDKKSYRRLCARVLQANSPARSARCTGLEGSVAKRLPPKFSFLTTPSSAEVPSSTLGFLRMLLRGIFGFESREAKGLTASRPPTRAPSSSTFRRACCAGSSRNAVRSPPSAPPAASAGEGRPGLPGAKASACSEAKATTRRRSAAAPSSSAPATRTGKQREPGSSRDLCNRRSCAETCANC
mmetsp:Transcript_9747/g.30240  ORF Transcript_9747/g.30240 Transcript_9747/m.30240 type:complete len:237 (+) Transcript_9747:241-951(+)